MPHFAACLETHYHHKSYISNTYELYCNILARRGHCWLVTTHLSDCLSTEIYKYIGPRCMWLRACSVWFWCMNKPHTVCKLFPYLGLWVLAIAQSSSCNVVNETYLCVHLSLCLCLWNMFLLTCAKYVNKVTSHKNEVSLLHVWVRVHLRLHSLLSCMHICRMHLHECCGISRWVNPRNKVAYRAEGKCLKSILVGGNMAQI